MITQTTITAPRTVVAAIGSRLAAFAEVLVQSSRLNRRAEEARRYFTMSDDELARHGLRRADIMRHVFGPQLSL